MVPIVPTVFQLKILLFFRVHIHLIISKYKHGKIFLGVDLNLTKRLNFFISFSFFIGFIKNFMKTCKILLHYPFFINRFILQKILIRTFADHYMHSCYCKDDSWPMQKSLISFLKNILLNNVFIWYLYLLYTLFSQTCNKKNSTPKTIYMEQHFLRHVLLL